MEPLMLRPYLVALVAGLLAMSPTNVFKICAWNAGTMRVDPWRIRTAAAVHKVSQTLRTWLASIGGWRLAFAGLAVLIAILAAHFSASHDGVLIAIATPIATLKANKEQFLREAAAFKKADGTFADDQARSSFDATMVEVEAVAEQIREAEANLPTPTPAPAPSDATTAAAADAARAAGVQAERDRITGIQHAVRVGKLGPELAEDMVKRGITIEAARAEIFAKLAENQPGPADNATKVRTGGEDERDKFLRAAGNALIIRSGMADIVARAEDPKAPPKYDAGEYRGFSLLDLARECLERAGVKTRGLDRMTLVGQAFTRSITQSTSDFAVLLENVMHKLLQAAYATQPDTWSRWCARGTVSDFRAHTRYRMGMFGALDSVGQDGEFKNKAINDAEKATITAATKGNIINVSRQMIVNDDLAAFTRLLTMLGRAAALSVEVDAYAELLKNGGLGPTQTDTNPLFHSSRTNVGTGAALSAASLDADQVLLGSQKDPWGNEFLDLKPAIGLFPLSLRGQAMVINDSQFDPDTVANKAQMKPNVVRGIFREIVGSPRLGGTRRYMFADPAIAPVFEVAFLEGQAAPVLESQNGWRVDGTEMKVRFDYGVAAVDFRGAVTNAGA